MITSSSDRELVSVIIPCYNHAHFFGEAVESVLGQTYPHIEIIVIDDGSTDDITQIITAYPSIRYIRQDNMGLSRARNVGLAHSKGAYVVFLDADDHLFPDAVAIGVRALAARTDCAFTFGLLLNVGTAQGMSVLSRDEHYDYKTLLQRNVIENPGSVLYRRWVFTEIGEFDAANSPAADYDLYLRVARRFPILCHHRPVVHYRRHGANMSDNARLMLASTLTVLKKQRRHVQGSEELQSAYNTGIRQIKAYYGELLIETMYDNLARGHFLSAVCDGYTLARFYPDRFLTFAKRKIAYLRSLF
jgi:glycosyltransferase involved in cell wall biosynthesis